MERDRQQKPLMGKPLTEVIAIKERHRSELMSHSIIVGVGMGQEEDPNARYFVIKGYLTEKPMPQDDSLPRVLEEVPIRYNVVGSIIAE